MEVHNREGTDFQSVSVNESKAIGIIKKLKEVSAGVTGDSVRSHSLREEYNCMSSRLESAVRLSKGPLPGRSAHWSEKLPGIIDDAVGLLNEAKEAKAHHPLSNGPPVDSNYYDDD